jgi:hypothetical protein
MTIKLKSIIKKDVQSNESKSHVSEVFSQTIDSRKLFIKQKNLKFDIVVLHVLSVYFLFPIIIYLTDFQNLVFSDFILLSSFFLMFVVTFIITTFNYKEYLSIKKQLKLIFNDPLLNNKQITRHEILLYGLGDIYSKNQNLCDTLIASLDNKNIEAKEIIKCPNLFSQKDLQDLESIIQYKNAVKSIASFDNKTI